MKITLKERAMLKRILDSEYQDGSPIDHDIWLDYVANTKSEGGVLSSLVKKGLIKLFIVSKADSDNYRFSRITDSTVCLTKLGVETIHDALVFDAYKS